MYYALQDYLKKMENIPMDFIFDRTFFTEEVYARLGYKEYNYTDLYQELVDELNQLNYEIYFLILYLEDVNLYEKRLDRKEHHKYQAFSIENSKNQQKEYLNIGNEVAKKHKIKVYPVAMDNFDEAYKKIKELIGIK